MQIFNYQFKPKLIPTLATLVLLPILVNLGLWQSNKADHKQKMQEIYENRAKTELIHIGAELINIESLRYSKVEVKGEYEPAYQILLDNQVHNGQAGYSVITPLHISGSGLRILVNRGWVPAGYDRNVLPEIKTPAKQVEIVGFANDPSGKYLELKKAEGSKDNWQKVWQNLDMKRYKSIVPFELQPVMILLDPDSSSGGFVREWPKPDYRIEVNRGYAIQWFLMTIALIIIYIVTNFKRVSPKV